MRLTVAVLVLLAACGGGGPSSAERTLIECVRSDAPDPGDCTSAFVQVQGSASGATAAALEAYNQCQSDEATGAATAPACEDEADALVAALEG